MFAVRSVPSFKIMDKRSYADVVSGSGKFIFAVSVLFGVLCLPQFYRFISLSGLSNSKSELLCG